MPVFRENPELLSAFRRGERCALERVYRFYARQMDRYLRSLVRRTSATEFAQASAVADLLQDMFIRAFAEPARNAYDASRDYTPYLCSIGRNCFIDALRRRRREVLQAPEDLPFVVSDETRFDDRYEPQVLAVLTGYLEQLPDGLRGVYEQRFVLGRSQQVVCDVLGVSRRHLRTREDHLRRGLRKALVHAGVYQTQDALGVVSLQASRLSGG